MISHECEYSEAIYVTNDIHLKIFVDNIYVSLTFSIDT